MFEIKNKITLFTILFLSIFILIIAYFIQYLLKHEPCNLCLIERIPYIISIIIISITLFLKKFEKFIFLLLSLVFIFGAFISMYHVGIEQGLFEESFLCNLNSETNILNKEKLLEELKKNIVSCKNVSFTMFGLSLASINTIVSIVLSIITLNKYFNYEKNK